MVSDVMVTEAMLDVIEEAEGVKQCHHARIAETQARGALSIAEARTLESIQGFLGKSAVMAEPFDLQEAAVAVTGDTAEPSARSSGVSGSSVMAEKAAGATKSADLVINGYLLSSSPADSSL